ncbi:hypothetical protein A33Q_0633 [Indibacter alkaliphilus LW1]|uniref:Uncharacterized protein n=1 Tax=Indibacter alkaliphilus (strain CCUG 57479 / KCTC 22604 / LW1) TaxID=1189612 RepID=S2DPX3_INDAL|nr:hypothetical protein A33Q_0633 [Indibacter alkaliphilus LW1]
MFGCDSINFVSFRSDFSHPKGREIKKAGEISRSLCEIMIA